MPVLYSIPSTTNMASRFGAVERELKSAWSEMLRLGCNGRVDFPSYTATAMIYYHYWINFGAVSRGAAAIGHASEAALSEQMLRAHSDYHVPTARVQESAPLVACCQLRRMRASVSLRRLLLAATALTDLRCSSLLHFFWLSTSRQRTIDSARSLS